MVMMIMMMAGTASFALEIEGVCGEAYETDPSRTF